MKVVTDNITDPFVLVPHRLKMLPSLRKLMLIATIFVFGTRAVWGQNTITINSISDLTICQGASVDVTISSTGTFNPGNVYSIQLSDENGIFTTPTAIGSILDFSNVPPNITVTIPSPISGSSNYTLRAISSDPLNIISPNYGPITIYSQLNPGAHNIDPLTVCENFNPAILEIDNPVPSGGQFPYSYQWYRNGGIIPGATLVSYDPPNLTISGTYIYNCEVTDVCGQSEETSQKIITVEPDPTITISGIGSVCQGDDEPILTTSIEGGSGTYTYLWDSGPSIVGPWTGITGEISSTYSPSTLTVGTFYYRVRLISNGAACNNSWDVEELVVNALPDPPTGTSPQEFCAINNPTIASIQINAAGSVIWYDAATAGSVLPTTTPLVTGTTYYVSQTLAGCESDTRLPVTVTLTPNNTITLSSAAGTDAQIVCINTPITPITYITTGATGATVTNLPTGVTGFWASNVVTISGTPSVAGAALTYTITLTGGCGTVNATGAITVTPNNTVSAASSTPTLCINTPLTSVTHTSTGATGIGIPAVLPAGVIATWVPNTITISGTPTASGTFNYSIPLTGGCGIVNATGTITVTPNNTVTAASSTPTLCINTPLTSITHTSTSATGIGIPAGLPASVSAAWAANTITISGTPTAYGTFNYSIPLTGGCGTVNATGTITVTANMTVGTASSTPTLCINTPLLTNITHTTTLATGIGSPTGLPSGVTATWASNTITLTGTPTASGIFNYSIPLTGGCGSVNATGTITVTRDNTVSAASSTPTLCINTALTNITHTTTGATGIGAAIGLPNGVTATWAANTIIISGTPTEDGPFNYSIPLTGGCGTVDATGTITVTPNNTVTAPSSSPSPCINTLMTSITHTTTGATGIGTAIGLPAGVNASWAANTITISGTPTASGTFNYSIPLTGGCGTVNATGTLTVTPNNTITLTSAVGTDQQIRCINTAITDITYATSGATGATVTGLPSGVTGAWAGNVVTISGTPSTSTGSPFYYTVTLIGGCGNVTATGSLTVNPLPVHTITYAGSPYCATGTASVTHSGEIVSGTYNALPSGLSINTTNGAIDLAASTPGTYTVTYSFSNGTCSNSTNASITITALPIPTAGSDSPRCVGSTLNLTSSGGTSYSWTGPNGFTSSLQNPSITNVTSFASGTYAVRVTENNGCSAISATDVAIHVLPTATISGSLIICSGASANISVILTGEGPWNLTYSDGVMSIPINGINTPAYTISANPSIPTTYTVTNVTDAHNCSNIGTGSVFINVIPRPTGFISGTTAICQGQSATLSIAVTGIGSWGGTLSDGTIFYSNLNPIPVTVSPSSSTTYTITSLSGNWGCTALPSELTGSATITVNPNNNISLSSPGGTDHQTVCINTPITNISYTTISATGATFSGLPPGVSGTWASNSVTISGTPTTTAGSPFTYAIALTGGCGTATTNGTITVTPNNTVSAASSSPTPCINTPMTSITHNTTGATGIGVAAGLPAGVSATWAANTITISGTPTASGTFNYSIPLTGGCGAVTATGTIIVNTPPSITNCPTSPFNLNTSSNLCTAVGNYSVTANGSPEPIFTYTFTDATNGNGSGTGSGSLFSRGTTTVSISAINDCGSAECSFNIVVIDNQAPVIQCMDIVQNADPGACNASVVLTATSNDNCSSTVTYDIGGTAITSPHAFPVGTTTVHAVATDPAGNTDECNFRVTVTDNQPPTPHCQNRTIYLDNFGNASINASEIDDGTTDNCGTPSLALSQSNFNCSNIGGNTVRLTATDNSGNSAYCDATVTVVDNIPPVAVCRNFALTLDASGTATLNPADINNGSSDNCGNPALTIDRTTFSCADVSTSPLTITLTAADASGNTSSCQTNVTIVSNLEITQMSLDECGFTFISEVSGGQGPYAFFWDATMPSNNNEMPFRDCLDPILCPPGNTSGMQYPRFNDLIPYGTYTTTLTVTDHNGCQVTRSMNFVIDEGLGSIEDINTEVLFWTNSTL